MNQPRLSAPSVPNLPKRCLLFAFVLIAIALYGCSSPTTVAPTPTPLRPTATPTLSPVAAQPGWTILVPLGYVSPGVVTGGTQFVAHKPYQVAVTCEGKGDLTITETISTKPTAATTTQVEHCTSALQGFEFMELYPKVGNTVSINIAADSNVVWKGILEEQQ
jgi:hypothetical protein